MSKLDTLGWLALGVLALASGGCAAAYSSITPIEDGYYLTRNTAGGNATVYFCQVQAGTGSMVCTEIDSL